MNKQYAVLENRKTKIKKDSHKLQNAENFNPQKETGLSAEQVACRIKENLVNSKPPKRSKSLAKIIFDNFFNFCNSITVGLVILLIAIGALDYAVSSFIIFISIIIGIAQEVRAKRTVEKLSLVNESTCEVIRDGKSDMIASRELVYEDIFKIWAGAQVPVDSVILEGTVEVDESILTGESVPVVKSAGDKLLAASNIVSGEVTLKAEKVGKDCYIENIARIARRISKPQSKIFYSLNKVIKAISFALIPLTVLLFISSMVVSGKSFNDSVIAAASSALAMIPIGMFLLTSTALAAGVIKLSKKNTLAKDLYSIEMLAMVDTLLLDKTGTITDGKLELVEQTVLAKTHFPHEDIVGAILKSTRDRNATAEGLRRKFGDLGSEINVKNSFPFSSLRKFSAIEADNGYCYVLGAPDFVTANDNAIDAFVTKNSLMCRRTLVLGQFKGTLKQITKEATSPLAIFALEDCLRSDVKETLNWFAQNGVDIKIVSGDNPLTVSHIALKSGVAGAEKYLNCQNIDNDELYNKVADTTVFGRVLPEQKCSIVNYLQKQGKVVGMIGDGVNDVQALKEADCSISFASANEVARNISRIVLMDSNFKSLPRVVEEGRSVIGNMEKVSALFIMKNIFVIFFTLMYAIIGLVTKDTYYPFDTKRMMLIEFFVLGIPTYALALQANRKRVDGNFLRNIIKSCIPAGLSLIAGVGFVLISFNLRDMSYLGSISDIRQYTASVAAIALTLAGFSALFIVALPLNKFRLIVISCMLLFTIAGIWLDGAVMDGTFLNISYPKGIDIAYLALSILIATSVNLLLRTLVKKLDKKYGYMLQIKTAKSEELMAQSTNI